MAGIGFTGPVGFGNLGRGPASGARGPAKPGRLPAPRFPGGSWGGYSPQGALPGTPTGRPGFGILPPKPTGPPKPAGPPQPGAPGPAAPATAGASTNPLDSTYFTNVALNNAKVGNQIAGINAQEQIGQTQLQAALAQLAYQQPRAALNLEYQGNRSGSLNSTEYAGRQGDLAYQYAGKAGGLADNFARTQANDLTKVGGLQADQNVYNYGQYEDAAARASANAAKTPGVNPPAVSATKAGPSTQPKGAALSKGKGAPKGTKTVKAPAPPSGSRIQSALNRSNAKYGG